MSPEVGNTHKDFLNSQDQKHIAIPVALFVRPHTVCALFVLNMVATY